MEILDQAVLYGHGPAPRQKGSVIFFMQIYFDITGNIVYLDTKAETVCDED